MRQKKYRHIQVLVGRHVLVVEDIDIELELKLIAAIKAYEAGLKSMDRLLRLYGESWRAQLELSLNKSSMH